MDVLRKLSELTASQWGMVTTAQAAARGISRMQLSRLAKEGQIERLGHGVYHDAGAPTDRLTGVKAAWLSTDPTRIAEERLLAPSPDAVVSGATAAYVLDLGDLVPEPYEFTTPNRRQTQRDELVFHMKKLAPQSVTIRDGLPVTTPEQTIADLIERRMDKTLVAGVFADVSSFDRQWLVDLLAPLALRNGFRHNDGEAFCADLEKLAHRDVDSLVRLLSPTLVGAELAKRYLVESDSMVIDGIFSVDPALTKQISQLVTAAKGL